MASTPDGNPETIELDLPTFLREWEGFGTRIDLGYRCHTRQGEIGILVFGSRGDDQATIQAFVPFLPAKDTDIWSLYGIAFVIFLERLQDETLYLSLATGAVDYAKVVSECLEEARQFDEVPFDEGKP